MEPLWDEQDHTYNSWGIGAKKNLQRSITITKLNIPPEPPPEYIEPGASGVWQLRSDSVRKSNKRFGVGTVVSGTGVQSVTAYAYTYSENYTYQEPAEAIG